MPLCTIGSCRRRKIQTLGLILLIVVIYYFLQFFTLSRLGGADQAKIHHYKAVNVKGAQDGEIKSRTDTPKDSDLSRKENPQDWHAAAERQEKEKLQVLRGVHPDAAAQYAPDSSSQFKCLTSEVHIPVEQVNDDFCDCPDSSDEPGTSACPNGRFYCRVQLPHQAAQFIHSSKVNDGICDCCDGSDEWQGRQVPAPMRLHGKRGAVFHAPCMDQCGNVLQLLEHEEKVRRQGLILQKPYLEAAKLLSPRHLPKFGPLGVFYLLSKECYQHASHEYLYTVCPFQEVKQSRGTVDRTVLGRQGQWTQQRPGDYVLLMGAGDSALCPDGQPRETQIRFLCGLEDRIVGVSEDQKCRYVVRFSTPAAC